MIILYETCFYDNQKKMIMCLSYLNQTRTNIDRELDKIFQFVSILWNVEIYPPMEDVSLFSFLFCRIALPIIEIRKCSLIFKNRGSRA
jgi:hypothetical protein